MNIQLSLTIDMVNTTVTALGQLQGAAQNALAAITSQAQEQIKSAQPPVEEAKAD